MPRQITTITPKVAELPDAFDVDRYRTLVPALSTNNIIYLNASSHPPMNLKVRQALDKHLDEAVYQPNPKPHWQALTEETRTLVGCYIDAPPESVAFTSNTTEGLNLFQRSLKLGMGDNVVILDTEHPNQAYGWLPLQETGLEVIGISSIMFQSGQKNNVRDICNTFRPRGIHVLVDMTQEVGVSPVSVTKNGVSAACFSFHKALGCPTGLGALYIDAKILNQLKQTPPIYRRVPFLMDDMTPDGVEGHLRSLGKKLQEECHKLGIEIIGEKELSKRAPHFCVLNLLASAWRTHFEENSVYVRCYRLGVRVSFGFYNTEADVIALAKVLEKGLASGIPIETA